MSINNFEINLIKFIQECGTFDLVSGEQKFLKSSNSLKRNIQNINSYLIPDKEFIFNGNKVISQMNYRDFLDFLKNLSLLEYSPTQEERIALIIINSFFKQYLNKSELYNDIHVSLTTLKKDTVNLKEMLKDRRLSMGVSPKKGIEITGNELQYRILCVTLLLEMTDLEPNGVIVQRKSNTPLGKSMVDVTLKNVSNFIPKGNFILNSLLESLNCKLSYGSRKFLILYLALSLYRIERGYLIENYENFNLSPINTVAFEFSQENRAFSYVFTSLDFTDKNFDFFDEKLDSLSKNLLEQIQDNIITKIQFKKELFSEIYGFLYKNILRSSLDYSLYDHKLENTDQIFGNLFNICQSNLREIEESFSVKFSPSQISAFTLILKKFITKSKLVGRNRKRIVIISNSSQEKLDFFVERLKLYIEAEVIACLSIDELEKISSIDFDVALTFSNRIHLLLEKKEIKAMKISFYLENNQIEKLLSSGFSRASRKILAKELTEKIYGRSPEEIENILKNTFPVYFV